MLNLQAIRRPAIRRPATLARAGRGLAVAATVGLLSACVQQPKPMYSWQAYQPSVYAYLKEDGSDSAVQAQALEKNIETARAANVELPPGFRAHLGMLYLKMGDGDKGVEQLQGEKVAFPESAPFMDFLMRNVGKPALATAAQPQAANAPAAPSPASVDAAAEKKGS
ncbi:hypothetical protein AKG08_04975 [Achromobacter piechaudii]|uniref:DUF4810 domain-containing protein n=1 Tax=Achromobacter piechaudii TaxID=72556 RepID=A0ABM8KS71_9BURK|nr:DUF4810 domain-containing protein [Achromobacter piechaudii]KNY11053.1 hypothetical protein AKG08_04975 [Achromobacter piechaudii]CAB3658099.1 hypothetical protein LMG1873_00429 [Achromobacter piechaudii]CAB3821999.1 hypothetical protein LMG2828_00505 [Achromobacter piechaudii]